MEDMNSHTSPMKIIGQGAEAIIEQIDGCTLRKKRLVKTYRLRTIDDQLARTRTRAEARMLTRASVAGIPVPKIIDISDDERELHMEFIDGIKVRDALTKENIDEIAKQIGTLLAKLHNQHIIHNDLTTSNMIIKDNIVYIIDFGLSIISRRTEDKAVDLHLLRCALDSYHAPIAQEVFKKVIKSYEEIIEDPTIQARLELVEARGRNKQG